MPPFKPAFKYPLTQSSRALWFIFHKDLLLLKNADGRYLIPCSEDLARKKLNSIRNQYLGELDGLACYAAELPDTRQLSNGFELNGLRETFGRLEEELIWVAGRANQLVDWNRNHQFCGQCGHPTQDKTEERAKICPVCKLVNYPRLSPAIIVAVINGDRLLLASNKRFKSGYYSVLAGFVEPGENLEECVVREIKEEVGITVKNVRYFGSQPWPFPNSLMVGFLADYDGGTINVDQSEIFDAAWFTADRLPLIPPKITIARHMIDWFINKHA